MGHDAKTGKWQECIVWLKQAHIASKSNASTGFLYI